METNVPAALNLPPVDQVGFVVKDIKAAIALYEPAFGPFFSKYFAVWGMRVSLIPLSIRFAGSQKQEKGGNGRQA